MKDMFWLYDPKVLFYKERLVDIWPLKNQSLEQKLNACTRLIILLTFLGYLCTRSIKIVITGAITLLAIIIVYKSQYKKSKKKKITNKLLKEGFKNIQVPLKQNFTQPTKKNPLMNVLLPEIQYKPKRKPAAPAFNPKVEKKINEKAADKKLFLDLGDNIQFDGSMRNFYATANTAIPNDQTAFAKYLYGNMPSCKEDYLQCSKNNYRNPT